MPVCCATTCKGKPCKNKVKIYSYCHLHIKQDIPLYTSVGEEWPTSEVLKKNIYRVGNVDLAQFYFASMLERYHSGIDNIYYRRVFVFSVIEFIKLNIGVCYNSKLNIFINTVADKLTEIGQLQLYQEDFKRKCVAGYLDNLKHQAKKKLVMFYMIHTEGLCYDVVEHIMTFY